MSRLWTPRQWGFTATPNARFVRLSLESLENRYAPAQIVVDLGGNIPRGHAVQQRTIELREPITVTFSHSLSENATLRFTFQNNPPGGDRAQVVVNGQVAGVIVFPSTRPAGGAPGTEYDNLATSNPVPISLQVGQNTIVVNGVQLDEFPLELDTAVIETGMGSDPDPPGPDQPPPNNTSSTARSLYRIVLGRDSDAGGVNHFTALLNAGTRPTDVAKVLNQSVEARTDWVATQYNRLLSRDASAAEIASLVTQLDLGRSTRDEALAGFYGSREFFVSHGNSHPDFVENLYLGILGRDSDTGGKVNWVGQLQAGVSPELVAMAFLTSTERYAGVVQETYRHVLGRTADKGGLEGWVNQLYAGRLRQEDLVAVFAGTPEFLGRVPAVDSETFMTPELLRSIAFGLTANPYAPDTIEAVPALDFPAVDFVEANSIQTRNPFDRDGLFIRGDVRASQNRRGFRLFIDDEGDSEYREVSYDSLAPNYSNIQPLVDRNSLPAAGKVIAGVAVGHQVPGTDSFPTNFVMVGDTYTRTNGDPPQTTGTSHRYGLHNVFDPLEDFPGVRRVYVTPLDGQRARILALVDSEGFTGALSLLVTPGSNTLVDVEARWFPRRVIDVGREPNTGFAGFSSLMFQDERTAGPGQEAHDVDTLFAAFDSDGDGRPDRFHTKTIDNPAGASVIARTDFANLGLGRPRVYSFENRDRDPAHYTAFAAANYAARSSHLIQVKAFTIPTTLTLFEQPTDGEVNDNVASVLASTLNLSPAGARWQGVYTNYAMIAYSPDDADGNGVADLIDSIMVSPW